MRRWVVVGGLVLALAPACSLKKMTAGMTVSVAKDAGRALDDESDYEMAAAAAPGSIKFLEGLIYVVPDNADLLLLLTRGYASYAFAFLEERAAEVGAAGKDDLQEKLQERAVNMYKRAGRYGLRLLGLKRGFDAAWKAGGTALDQKLAEFEPAEVGQLFWTAYAYMGAANLAQSPELLVMLPKIIKLVERALALDETYFFGGPHLLLGGYYLALPKILGGNPKKARAHFEKALKIAGPKVLLPRVMYAALYARKVGDHKLMRRLLAEVEEGSIDGPPGTRLANVIAKRKAARLAKQSKED